MDQNSNHSSGKKTLRGRFMDAWRSGSDVSSPTILHHFLKDLPESERETAFCELLELDIRFRIERGERPTREAYESSFPDVTHLIRSVFDRMGLDSGESKPSRGTGGPHAAKTNTYHSSLNSEIAETEGWAQEASTNQRDESEPKIEGYEILGKLGQGGMGVVYKARDIQLNRLVALKRILPAYAISRTMLNRFFSEARAVAKLSHPNLVPIFLINQHDGQPYIAFEYVKGGNLAANLRGIPQSPTFAARLLEVLALAMEHAHSQNIVHCDLKPSNILMTVEGVPKIADFGLARQIGNEIEVNNRRVVIGTPSYMSPEQASGRLDLIGPASDIYSLGVILYEMLTGRPPFRAAKRDETVRLVQTQEPIPPKQLVPSVPRDLELICLRCLKKDPNLRFESADELANELRRFQEGRPIFTRPASPWEVAWKWARRNRAAASLIAVAIVALFSLVLVLDQRARLARRELSEQQRVTKLRSQVQVFQFKAREATEADRLQDAKGFLRAAFEVLGTESDLQDLEPALAQLQTDLTKREAKKKEKQKANDDLREFFKYRDTALFHGMVFTGVDIPTNTAKAQQACRDALAILQVETKTSTGPVFSEYLSLKQRQEATRACYEMLLILAEAEKQSALGGNAVNARLVTKAIETLDRAAQLDVPQTLTHHLRRAACLEILKEFTAAKKERELAAAKKPAGSLDHFLLADMYRQEGKLPDAARSFARALQAQPDHFWARYFLAICNLLMERPDRARDNLTACMTARDDFLWLYVFRGFANGQLNDFNSAEMDLNHALTLNPDEQAIYGIRIYQGVLAIRQARLNQFYLTIPWPNPALANLDLALRGVVEADREQKLSAAASFLDQAVATQPEQYPAYRYLAVIAQERTQPDRALAFLDQALLATKQVSPAIRARLLGERARLHRQQFKLDAALADFDTALKLSPVANDYAERGRILFVRKKFGQSLSDIEAALRLQPDVAEYHRWHAETLLALNKQAEAAEALDQYLAKGGRPTAEIMRTRGMLRGQLRQFPLALVNYTQSLRLQPDSQTYTARAWLFLANDVAPLALQDFEQALRLDASNGEAYAGRGLIRVFGNDYEGAFADADAALRHGPPSPRLFWNAAHVYAQIAGRLASGNFSPNNNRERMFFTARAKAVSSLTTALELLSPAERFKFWKKHIEADVFLDPIRGTSAFRSLRHMFVREDLR